VKGEATELARLSVRRARRKSDGSFGLTDTMFSDSVGVLGAATIMFSMGWRNVADTAYRFCTL